MNDDNGENSSVDLILCFSKMHYNQTSGHLTGFVDSKGTVSYTQQVNSQEELDDYLSYYPDSEIIYAGSAGAFKPKGSVTDLKIGRGGTDVVAYHPTPK